MLFVVPVVLFDMLKAKQLACVSESGQKCPAARRSPYGERGLKFARVAHAVRPVGRSPYGERGLKFYLSGTRPHQINRSPYGERGLK